MRILLLIAVGLTAFNTLCITRYIVQTENRLQRLEFIAYIDQVRRKRFQKLKEMAVNDEQ